MPLYIQLAESLSNEIASGRYHPGDRLPSEAVLERTYGVSRITVRMAMQRLANAGVVARERGRGTFVPRLDQRVGFTRCLEEEMADQGISWRVELLSNRVVRVPTSVNQILKLDKTSEVLRLERLRVVNDRTVGWELRYLPWALASQFDAGQLASEPAVVLMDKAAGTPVDELEVTVTCRRVGKTPAKALGLALGEPSLVRGTIYKSQGRIVGCGECYYRADRFQFTYTLGRGAAWPTSRLM